MTCNFCKATIPGTHNVWCPELAMARERAEEAARASLGTDPRDMVNHPPHYAGGKVECIDALEVATAELTGIEAVCTANAIKYLWRWKKKGGHEDLKKARWYINRMLGDTP